MKSMFSKIGQAAKVAFAAIAVAAGAIFVAAIKSAAEFEQAMAMVRAVTGATGAEFDALTEKAKQLGRDTKFSMTEIASGMEFLGRAGFDANEIIASMDGVTALAASQMMDLGRAADITSNILTGFGLSADQAERTANLLAATAASANVNVEMLGETMKYIAPLASAAGWSLEETAAAAGKLGDAGIQASMAGTSLRMAIASLMEAQAGDSPLNEALDALNLSIEDLEDNEGNLLSLAEVMGVLDDAGADAADMLAMFGKRAGPAMTVLLNEGEEALAAYTEELTGTDAAFEQMAIQLDTLEGQWTVMKGSVSLLFQTLGESLMPVLKDLLKDHIIPLINKTQLWVEKMGGIRGMVGHAMVAIGQYIQGVAEWILSHEYLADGINALWRVFQGLLSFIQNVFRGNWSAAWDAIKTIAINAFEAIKSFALAAWEALPIPDNIKKKIETVLGDIRDAVKTAFQWIVDNKEIVIGAFSGIAVSLVALKIPTMITAIAAAFTALLSPVNLVVLAVAAFGAGIGALVKYWDEVRTFLSNLGGAIVDVWEKFQEFGASIDRAIINGLSSAWHSVTDWFRGAWNGLIDTIVGWMPGWMQRFLGIGEEIGESVGDGVAQGITNSVMASLDAVDKLSGQIGNRFEKLWEIQSPSKVTEGYGENIGEGFVVGLLSTGRSIQAAGQQILDDLKKDQEESASEAGTNTGETYTEGVAEGISDGVDEVSDAVDEVVVVLEDGVKELAESLDELESSLAKTEKGSYAYSKVLQELSSFHEDLISAAEYLTDNNIEVSDSLKTLITRTEKYADATSDASDAVETLEGKLSEMLTTLNDAEEGSYEYSQALQDLAGFHDDLVAAEEYLIENNIEVSDSLKTLIKQTDEYSDSSDDATDSIKSQTKALLNLAVTAVKDVVGAYKKMRQEAEDFAQSIRDIHEEFDERDITDREEADDAVEDEALRHARKMEDIEKDYARAKEDIRAEDYEDANDYLKKIADAEQDYREDKEDEEIRHTRELEDINTAYTDAVEQTSEDRIQALQDEQEEFRNTRTTILDVFKSIRDKVLEYAQDKIIETWIDDISDSFSGLSEEGTTSSDVFDTLASTSLPGFGSALSTVAGILTPLAIGFGLFNEQIKKTNEFLTGFFSSIGLGSDTYGAGTWRTSGDPAGGGAPYYNPDEPWQAYHPIMDATPDLNTGAVTNDSPAQNTDVKVEINYGGVTVNDENDASTMAMMTYDLFNSRLRSEGVRA